MHSFDDTVELTFVSFTKHVNLGGESSKTMHTNGTQCRMYLHVASGQVIVQKLSGTFWVSAACIESCEQSEAGTKSIQDDIAADDAALGHEKAEYLKDKAAKATKTRDAAPKSGKMTDSQPPMSRADEILAEFNGK